MKWSELMLQSQNMSRCNRSARHYDATTTL